MSDRADAIAHITTLGAIGIPASLLVSSVLGWLLAGAALRPIERLRTEASAITLSGLDHWLTLPPAADEFVTVDGTDWSAVGLKYLGPPVFAELRHDRLGVVQRSVCGLSGTAGSRRDAWPWRGGEGRRAAGSASRGGRVASGRWLVLGWSRRIGSCWPHSPGCCRAICCGRGS